MAYNPSDIQVRKVSSIERFNTFKGYPDKNCCIPWTGYIRSDGYGSFRLGEKMGAHRAAYLLSVAAIPDGMEIHHTCHNPICVNTDHLKVVTPAENKAAHNRKGFNGTTRTQCSKGHERTTENTIIRADGSKKCRECKRIYQKIWMRNKRKNT